eukprot:552064_1
MATKPIYIWQDSITAIWKDLQPPTAYYPISSLYPSFAVICVITVVHYIMDKTLLSKASKYANNEVNLIQPEWINSSKYSSDLTKQKLIKISRKKLQIKLKKIFDELDSTQTQQLISYHKQLTAFEKHISKFLEASFKCIVFGFIYAYGLGLIFVDGKWFWDQKWMWSQSQLPGSPTQPPGDNAIFNLDIYYFLQIGYHGHRATYQFFEHRRRDFWAMFIHHWVTVFLLGGSKMVGYQQIGATVLLCNDNMDLFMPLAKLCEYTGYRTLQTIFTILFVVLWIPFRIGVYFYKVIYSIAVDGYEEHLRPFIANWLCLIGLTVIYLLQFYWTGFLLKMVWSKLLKGKGVKDVRSDDEDGSANLKKHN